MLPELNKSEENILSKMEDKEISIVLEKLSSLLERSIAIVEENRKNAIDNYNYFSNAMKLNHSETETISEEGILEKETNHALKLLIESSKTLNEPITALTKVLTTKINVEAIKGVGGITKPIDISDYR